MITENIKYPGSDKKPKACPKVISWHWGQCFTGSWLVLYKFLVIALPVPDYCFTGEK